MFNLRLYYSINKTKLHLFVFCVQAIAIEEQKSKFCTKILSTETGYIIYASPWPTINVKARFCA